MNVYRNDGVLSFTERVTADSGAIDALLPAEPAVNDSLFVSALQTIQGNIGNAILMDATEADNTAGDSGQDSAARWQIVNDEIAQMEAATTAQELTAILNGERVTVAASPTPTPEPEVTYTTLSKGDKSDEVLEMQNRLYMLGFLLDDRDGAFGKNTQTAVKMFQQAAGLEVTGIADSATLQRLYAEDAPRTEYAQATPTPPTPKKPTRAEGRLTEGSCRKARAPRRASPRNPSKGVRWPTAARPTPAAPGSRLRPPAKEAGAMPTPIVALIYDFDKTLSPRDMEEYSFLPGINVEPDVFWGKCAEFAREHDMDGILTYMYLMKKMASGEMELTRENLIALGRDVEFFPGVTQWFDRINAIGRECGVSVEHYIISSGLTEIIRGSAIGKYFKAIFAASFCYDEDGRAVWPSTAVNYTSKTQYLFRINKGILDVTNDRDLNAFTPEYMRRVPFSNMIYVGDGLTDVPCMKMTKQKGGYSIAVHAPGATEVADDMLLQGRVDFSVEADYTPGSEIEQVVTMLMRRIRASHELTLRHAEQVQRAHRRRGKYVPLDIPMRGGLDVP